MYLKDRARTDAKLKGEKYDENTVEEKDSQAKFYELDIIRITEEIKVGYEAVEVQKVNQQMLEKEVEIKNDDVKNQCASWLTNN